MNINIVEWREIVCIGCGLVGRDFVEIAKRYEHLISIEYFLDNNYLGDFCGYDCKKISKDLCLKKKIVVCISNEVFANQIYMQLQSYGLEWNTDFLEYGDFIHYLLRIPDDNRLKISFKNFWPSFDDTVFNVFMMQYLEYIIDDNRPDVEISSVFSRGDEDTNAVRICFSGENIRPDFNTFDYFIGFDYIENNDRYLRWPLYYLSRYSYKKALIKHQHPDDSFYERDFCSVVVSNGNCAFRNHVHDLLNSYKTVKSGGKYKNNLPNSKPVSDKISFIKKYKFNLAMENEEYPGYVTEKIIDAWAAGCIPIYWGSERIYDEFQKGSFINVSDFRNEKDLLEYIEFVDSNSKEANAMLSTPIFKGQYENPYIKFCEFIVNAYKEGKSQL